MAFGAAMFSPIATEASGNQGNSEFNDRKSGAGVLAAWFDIEDGSEQNVLEWHNRQHFPERLKVPGFLQGRRYVAVEARSRYFILYDVEDTSVLTSPAYMRRLNNPTTWTMHSVKKMINQRRVVASVLASDSIGAGGFIATMRFSAAPGVSTAELRQAAQSLVDATMACPGIVSIRVCNTDAAASSLTTTESRVGGHTYVPTELFMSIEAISPQSLHARFHNVLATGSMAKHGLIVQATPEIFQLQILVSRQQP